MPEFSQLALKAPFSARHSVDPDDVVVVKRSLQRLGHYTPWDGKLNHHTDDDVFNGIQNFQKSRGLRVDGVMEQDGETAQEIGRLMSSVTTRESVQTANNDSPNDEIDKSKCDYLYYQVDLPTCDGIFVRRGKQAAARCYHTATVRYAACLKGVPMDELPPLDVINWR